MSPPAHQRAERIARDVRIAPHVAPQPRGADGAARRPYHPAKHVGGAGRARCPQHFSPNKRIYANISEHKRTLFAFNCPFRDLTLPRTARSPAITPKRLDASPRVRID